MDAGGGLAATPTDPMTAAAWTARRGSPAPRTVVKPADPTAGRRRCDDRSNQPDERGAVSTDAASPDPLSPADCDRLDPRVRWLWSAWAALAALVGALAGGVTIGLLTGPAVAAAFVLGWLVATLSLAWWYPAAHHARWRYRLTDLGLEISHGVVRRVDTAIPYLRIQHIDVAQGPLERALGLVSLVVHTAAATADVTVPGISAGDADHVRGRLLDRAVAAAQVDGAAPDAV